MVMRVQRRALILDVDGYETPVFSPDGRLFAIRGNAYENTLEVFEFPSLLRVFATSLGERSELGAWSRHNIAFGTQPGVLWIGTPNGTLMELDLPQQKTVEHEVLSGSPVTGLAATATGELVVAGGSGELVLLSADGDATDTRATARAAVTAFLDATSDVPGDGDLEKHLVRTDGTRSWDSDDLTTVTTATATDPTWLRLQAALNTARDQRP
jgi:hypothetical protein